VEIKTLEQLTTLDAATLGPYVGNAAFVQFLQEQVAGLELVAGVPEDVRKRFERCRKLFVYGLFDYEFFTVAADYAHLTQEAALRERIREKDPDRGLWLDSNNAKLTSLVDIAISEGVLSKQMVVPLALAVCEPGKKLADLILGPPSEDEPESVKEARRAWEGYKPTPAGIELRNRAAHATSDVVTLSSPYSLGTIQRLAVLINHLWRPASDVEDDAPATRSRRARRKIDRRQRASTQT
jgi:hypothetical protein